MKAPTQRRGPQIDLNQYQTHWHPEEICDDIPNTPDTFFVYYAWDRLVRRSAAGGRAGRILDVACGNARDIVALADMGCEVWGLDPSHLQLRDAREAARRENKELNLVRGVGEWLPFKPGTFDSLINKSALDHFVEHDRAMSEFARVLRPGGRAVVSVNNYAGLTTQASRLLYRLVRKAWPQARSRHFMWDSPVPWQHTYECTYDNTKEIGAPYFKIKEAYGVSLFWGFPGWGRFLSIWPKTISFGILRAVNRLARPIPHMADVSVFVWQPKPESERPSDHDK
jgi:ubiquinone/menaquinone biosynthesis C-methylase UbiE